MKKVTIMGLLLAVFLFACGGAAPEPTPAPQPTEAPEIVEETPTEGSEPTEETAPTEVPEEAPAEAAEPDEPAYTGPVTEMAIRRVGADLSLEQFVANREAYIAILQQQDGIVADREFGAFLDFSTFAPPEPLVFIGMTEYESLEAFGAASGAAGSTPEAETFFGSFDLEVFAAMRPLNPEDSYALAEMGIEPGQVLEVAARDLSTYENFDPEDYATKRDIFLEALSQQEGFVQEYQWVSLLDENIVVGMTVYESANAYQTINTSDFVNTAEYTEFVFTYPFVAGFANFDVKPAGVESITPAKEVAFPESIAVNGDMAYVSNFFDGSIHTVDLATGETSQLVEAGRDGVVAGWGLWLEDESGLLLSCGNRNFVPGPQENINAARAIDLSSGETVEVWELPEGAACNSILSVANGDIYISDVSPNADIIKIERATGETAVWVDDPSWENDSGFGAGGLVWDGDSSLYVSAAGIIRLPINDDGTAGTPVPQRMIDANGNDTFFSFDGFAFDMANGTMIGAAFDFNFFQSQIIELTIVDDETVQGELRFVGAVGATGVDAKDGVIYVADGQIIQALFNEGYEPTTPFSLFTLSN